MKEYFTEKSLNELNLKDAFLFAKVMSNRDVCRKVLEKILNIQIEDVLFPTGQEAIDLVLNDMGIYADICLNDGKGTICSCEMQLGKYGDSPKRSRFDQEKIDHDCITGKQPCGDLQKSFIIYICTFDPFQMGRHSYTFQNTCKENPDLLLGEDATILFLNTKGIMDDVDEEMKKFLAYIEKTTDSFVSGTGSQLIREIHRKVTEIKQDKSVEDEYMKLLQRDRQIMNMGRKRGQSEGEEKMAALVRLLLKEGRTKDLEQVSEDFIYREELYKEFQIN